MKTFYNPKTGESVNAKTEAGAKHALHTGDKLEVVNFNPDAQTSTSVIAGVKQKTASNKSRNTRLARIHIKKSRKLLTPTNSDVEK